MDMSKKPEGATHYVEGSTSPWEKRIGDDWFAFNDDMGWWCCSRGTGDSRLESNMAPVPIVATPTLETMLAEWRDLEARAQAARSEADALFEHAGQLHGEIVVRLAELGWGASRGPMVTGEPVVTLDTPLDITDWRDLREGDVIKAVADGNWVSEMMGVPLSVIQVEHSSYKGELPIFAKNDRDDTCWGISFRFISRPSTQP